MAANGNRPSGWLDDLYFQVGERTSHAAGVAASGDGFSLSRECAEQLIKQLHEILYQLEVLRGDAMAFSQMKPPASDPVSRKFNDAVAGSGPQYGVLIDGAGHIQREIAYLRDLRSRLKSALGDTVTTDEHNKENLRPI